MPPALFFGTARAGTNPRRCRPHARTQAAGTHLTTLLTLTSSLLAVLPVLPAWAPVVPACAELALSRGHLTGAVLLFVAHWLVVGQVDEVIMSEIQPSMQ